MREIKCVTQCNTGREIKDVCHGVARSTVRVTHCYKNYVYPQIDVMVILFIVVLGFHLSRWHCWFSFRDNELKQCTILTMMFTKNIIENQKNANLLLTN